MLIHVGTGSASKNLFVWIKEIDHTVNHWTFWSCHKNRFKFAWKNKDQIWVQLILDGVWLVHQTWISCWLYDKIATYRSNIRLLRKMGPGLLKPSPSWIFESLVPVEVTVDHFRFEISRKYLIMISMVAFHKLIFLGIHPSLESYTSWFSSRAFVLSERTSRIETRSLQTVARNSRIPGRREPLWVFKDVDTAVNAVQDRRYSFWV